MRKSIHSPTTSLLVSSNSKQRLSNSLKPFTLFRTGSRDLSMVMDKSVGRRPMNNEFRLLKYFVRDYIAFHAANRKNASRILLFRPYPSGMGDQFRALVFAYWTAVLSRRVLLIDWQEPFSVENLFETANESTDMFFRKEIDIDPLAASSHAMLNSSEQSHSTLAEIVESNIHTVVHSPWLVAPTITLTRLASRNFPHRSTVSEIRMLLVSVNFQRSVAHLVLRLSPSIRDFHFLNCRSMRLKCGKSSSLSRIAHSFNAPQDFVARPYISVHARLGLGVGESGERFIKVSKNVLVPARCLASRAVRLALLAGTPALPIFLATDTPAFREIFQNVVTEMSSGRVAVLNGNWSVAHSNKVAHDLLRSQMKKNKLIGLSRSKAWESVWGSYMDLVMLGHGEHVVALYSSFVRFAMAIGDAETLTELRNEICTNDEHWI